MKKGGGLILILIVFSLLFFPFLSSAPKAQTNVNIEIGIEVEYLHIDTFEKNQDIHFAGHIFNISNGLTLTNTTTTCFLHLLDNKGNHIIEKVNMNFNPTNDAFHYTVNKGNFTRLGEYNPLIICNATNIGGFVSYNFHVTTTGEMLDEGRAIVYFILLMGVFFIFFLTLWGAIVLPIKNKRNGLDEVIDVDYLKYAKVSFMFLSYTLLIWIINLLLTLSDSFLIATQYSGFFTMTFEILRALIWPVFVLMIIVFFILGARDLKLNKLLTKGLTGK